MRIVISISFLLSFAIVGNAQIAFYKYFSNNGVDVGQGVVQLEDSSYVITGYSSSFNNGPSQAILLKIDSLGNYVWSHHYGGSEVDAGRRVLYKENVGFYICGYTNSIGSGGYDFYLAKVAENTNLEWEKAFGGTGWEKVHDAALTRDTGIIMVGETSSNATDNKDIYIVKTDKDGNEVWSKTYGSSKDDYVSSIRQFNDSMFVIGGRMYNEDSLMTKGYLAYMKDDGTFLWEDTIGINGDYWINDITFNGNLIYAVGGTSGDDKVEKDLYFYLCDLSGNVWGQTEYPAVGDHENMLATTYGSGDFLVPYLAVTDQTYEDGPDLDVAKYFSSSYGYSSSYWIAHDGPDIPGQIIPTSDGGAIIVGYSTGVVSGGNELFAVKIGPNDLLPNAQTDMQTHNLVSLDETEELTELVVYPNPANMTLELISTHAEMKTVELIDPLGKVVRSMEVGLEGRLNTSDIENGWYILRVSMNGTTGFVKKVVIQH